jgi:hypothetical protein
VTNMWVGAFCRWRKRISGLATCTLHLHGRLRAPSAVATDHRHGSLYTCKGGYVDTWMQEATVCAVKWPGIGPLTPLCPGRMEITAARRSGPQSLGCTSQE